MLVQLSTYLPVWHLIRMDGHMFRSARMTVTAFSTTEKPYGYKLIALGMPRSVKARSVFWRRLNRATELPMNNRIEYSILVSVMLFINFYKQL